jgi:hypothetical protein
MADPQAVNPATGEVLEHLDQQPPAALAEALEAIHTRQADLKQWSDALEGELRRRLKILGDRRFAQFGDWEVVAEVSRSREWDADELENVLAQLCDEGIIRAGETADLIVRKSTVAAKAALALRSRLGPEAQTQIDTAWTWKERRKPLQVARSVALPTAEQMHELLAADHPSAEAASDSPADRVPPSPSADPAPAQPTAESAATRAPSSPAAGPAPLVLDPKELFR